MNAFIIIGLVVAALIGGIMTLLSTRNSGMPNKDVLERAKERTKAEDARDAKDEDA